MSTAHYMKHKSITKLYIVEVLDVLYWAVVGSIRAASAISTVASSKIFGNTNFQEPGFYFGKKTLYYVLLKCNITCPI